MGKALDIKCNHTGFRGRIGLYEVLVIDEDVKALINAKATSYEIQKLALNKGMTSLRQDGIAKLKAGITTVGEVLRETTLG